MRIDAHQHFWHLAARNGAWPPPMLSPIYRDFYPDDLSMLLAQNGVAATVVVQSLPDETDTYFLLKLADSHAFIGAVVGWVDLKAALAPSRIAAMSTNPKLCGLRPMLQDLEDDNWINDSNLDPAVEAMLLNDLSFDALVLPRHLPALLAFAKRYPMLPIAINHIAKPIMSGPPDRSWRNQIDKLAALPNVECKLSGLVTEVGPDWTVDQLRPFAHHVLQSFGPERVMWGSDWPVLTLASDYAAWCDASEALMAHLSKAQRDAVFGLNAARFYGIA